jgi:D-arabinose 1-dehydrogenase-like Zn-dependent alcohol dehydrogenase
MARFTLPQVLGHEVVGTVVGARKRAAVAGAARR